MRVSDLRTGWFVLAIIAGWFALSHFVIPKPIIEAERIFEFSLAVGGLVALWPDYVLAMGKPLNRLTTGDVLTLSLFSLLCGFGVAGSWQLLWRLGGQPAWMVNSDVQGAALAMFIFGLTLLLSAPGIKDGRVPTRGRLRVAMWWVAAALGVGMLAALQPDPVHWIDWLKPVLAEDDARLRVYGTPTPLPGPP